MSSTKTINQLSYRWLVTPLLVQFRSIPPQLRAFTDIVRISRKTRQFSCRADCSSKLYYFGTLVHYIAGPLSILLRNCLVTRLSVYSGPYLPFCTGTICPFYSGTFVHLLRWILSILWDFFLLDLRFEIQFVISSATEGK